MNPTVIVSVPDELSQPAGPGAQANSSNPSPEDKFPSSGVRQNRAVAGVNDDFEPDYEPINYSTSTQNKAESSSRSATPKASGSAGGRTGPAIQSSTPGPAGKTKCPVCSTENQAVNSFCLQCGSKLKPSAPAPTKPSSPAGKKRDEMRTIEIHSESTEEPAPNQRLTPGAGSGEGVVCPRCSEKCFDNSTACPNCGAKLPVNQTLIMKSISPKPKGRLTLITEDGSSGQVYDLQDQTAIGRTEGDISFPYDGYMSGRHASITQRGGSFLLADENSRNGTFIRIKGEIELKPGDVIMVGRELFRFDLDRS